MLNKTIKKYLEELSSDAPTPGGGNVAALCGAISVSLGIMVCNLTIGKKKYEEVENDIKMLKEKLEKYIENFLILAKKDNEAFERVMDAFRLPKENNEQKALRAGAIEKASEGAALVPAEVIRNCMEVVRPIQEIARKGNKNSLSDAGVALSLISSAAESAFLNVLINCASLNDRNNAKKMITETETLYGEVKAISELSISEIIMSLKNP